MLMKNNRKILRYLKNNYLWLAFIFLNIIFILIAFGILKNKEILLDTIIYNFVNSFSSTATTTFFKIITQFAGGYILVGICILTFLFIKKKSYFYLIFINFVNTIIFNQVLKHVFLRKRPIGIAIVEETGYSFPSGHSMAAMSFYGLLIYVVFKSKMSNRKKLFLIIILSMLILLIGISRIYLGVHYASDVIGGFCLSLSYLIVFTRIIEKVSMEVKVDDK